jgi:general nucleoside transport system permease protein
MSDQVHTGGPAEAAEPDPPGATGTPAADGQPGTPDAIEEEITGSPEPAVPEGPGKPWGTLTGNVVLPSIIQGSPIAVSQLAMFAALVIGGILIVVSDPVVLHAWDSFGYSPGGALSATWHSVAAAYSAMFEGAIFSPATIGAAFHGGSIAAIF